MNIEQLTRLEKEKLAQLRHIALDMDGTIYSGGTLFDFTIPFLKTLKDLNIGFTFLTNNSSRSVKDYLVHLRQMKIPVEVQQVYSSSGAAIQYLTRELPSIKKIFLLGTQSLHEEFEEAGFQTDCREDEPDAVVVAFDTNLEYQRLCKAAWWISKGKPYIATHPDRVCPTDQPTILVDCGAICACLESATGRKPDAVLGKPDPCMLSDLLKRHELEPGELAMVGDRLYTDIAMARCAGCMSILVLSGETSGEVAELSPEVPDLVVPSLRELEKLLSECRFQFRNSS